MRGACPPLIRGIHLDPPARTLSPLRHYSQKKARDLFLKQAYSEESMHEYYLNWRDDKIWMKGEKWSFPKKGPIISSKCSWPLAKRGDPQYKDNLRDKLSWIEELPSESLFNPTDRSKTVQTTNWLFLTDTAQIFDRFYSNREKHDIWREDSARWNRFMTRMRQFQHKKYGRVYYWRSNEGTTRGFPAPHSVLFTPDYVWNIKLMTVKRGRDKGKRKWRIFGEQFKELKDMVEGKDSRAKPVAGFSDIQGIHNPRGALKHISKYCFGAWIELDGTLSRKAEIQELTYFWLWITRKHTYSNSRDFNIKVQVFLKVSSDLTPRLQGISKDVWVYLAVCSPAEAQRHDPCGIPIIKEIPWPG